MKKQKHKSNSLGLSRYQIITATTPIVLALLIVGSYTLSNFNNASWTFAETLSSFFMPIVRVPGSSVMVILLVLIVLAIVTHGKLQIRKQTIVKIAQIITLVTPIAIAVLIAGFFIYANTLSKTLEPDSAGWAQIFYVFTSLGFMVLLGIFAVPAAIYTLIDHMKQREKHFRIIQIISAITTLVLYVAPILLEAYFLIFI